MIYSATTEYAIRALSHIATLERGQRILARDLATATHIPRQFLGKILHRLARLEFLDSAKGRGGGFRFAREPEEICVHDVVAAMEGEETHKACVLGLDACDESQPCPMHDEWVGFRRTLMERVYAMTIADLGRNLAAKRASYPRPVRGPDAAPRTPDVAPPDVAPPDVAPVVSPEPES